MKLFSKYFSKKPAVPTDKEIQIPNRQYYYFNVINSRKIEFESETDPDIKRSYGYHDEGDFPLHLKQNHIEKYIFYSYSSPKELSYSIFRTYNKALRKKNLYRKPSTLQTFFKDKCNICFFYESGEKNDVLPFSQFTSILTFKDFCDQVLPNLKIELIKELNKDALIGCLIYNWNFFIDEGIHNGHKENYLAKNLNSIPFQDLCEVENSDLKKLYAFENLCELTHLSHDVKLQGLKINISQNRNLLSEILVGREKNESSTNGKVDENLPLRVFPKQRSIVSTYKGRIAKFSSELSILERALGEDQLPFIVL